MENPPEGLSGNFIDGFWETYESDLPGAVERFERDEWTSRGWETVLLHMVAAVVHHLDFERVAVQYRSERGEVVSHQDDVQRERLLTLQNTPALLAEGRCAVLRTAETSNSSCSTTRDSQLSEPLITDIEVSSFR